MKSEFIETSNSRALMQGFASLQRRGAQECCFMIVDGVPGLGKTTTAEWWAIRHGMVFLRAATNWTARGFLGALLEELQVTPEFSMARRFTQAHNALLYKREVLTSGTTPFAVVIDEADHVTGSKEIIETIRDLTDNTQVPFVLIGMDKIRPNLVRHPQVASRVSQYVQFNRLTADDNRALIEGLCEIPVDRKLIDLVHHYARGFAREVKEAIATIEVVGRKNAGRVVEIKDMVGKVLMNDRATGNPIKVTEV